MIGGVGTSPPCGLNRSLQVANKQQSTSPHHGQQHPKLDAVVDGKLPDDLDSASIFSKVIGHKISDGSSNDLYLRCRMNYTTDAVQTQVSQFMNLGLPLINTLDESGILSTTPTRIWRTTDGTHWMAPDHISCEMTAVGMSAAK